MHMIEFNSSERLNIFIEAEMKNASIKTNKQTITDLSELNKSNNKDLCFRHQLNVIGGICCRRSATRRYA